jgi:hypothetical protein
VDAGHYTRANRARPYVERALILLVGAALLILDIGGFNRNTDYYSLNIWNVLTDPFYRHGVGRFLGAMVQSMGDSISSGIAQLQADTGRKHRTHEERQSYIAEYLSREYPKRARPPMTPRRGRRLSPATKTVMVQHDSAFAAMARLKSRDVAGAEKLAAAGLANGGDKQIEPALAMARVRLTRGDRVGALTVLDSVARDGEPALPVATARAWAQEASGKPAEAARILEAAKRISASRR